MVAAQGAHDRTGARIAPSGARVEADFGEDVEEAADAARTVGALAHRGPARRGLGRAFANHHPRRQGGPRRAEREDFRVAKTGGHPGKIFEMNEGLESVFYGTLLNIFKAFDRTELNQIESFTHTDTNGNEFQALLVEALSDSPSPSVWTDKELSDHVTVYAKEIIDGYWNDDNVSGILDLSYVALAVA